MTHTQSTPSFVQLLEYAPPTDLLKDRIILITGAGDGIGRAVSMSYARHGAQLVLLDWNRKALEYLYDEIVKAGGQEPSLCPVDLSGVTIDGLRDIARHIADTFGVLDGLLNNASWVGDLTPFEHYQPKVWAKVMNVNLAAPFFLTQWCMPLLRKAKDPAIGFSLHDTSRAFWGGFAMAKAGQEAQLHVLANEYHLESSQPIRIFGVDTGPVMTPGRRQNYPGEAIDAHPYPDTVVGPYLYAMGSEASGHTEFILKNEATAGAVPKTLNQT